MKLNTALLVAFVMLFISPLSFAENKVEIVLKKDIKLTLIMIPFVTSKHRIKRCGKESVCLIDDLPFFGSDGQLPKRQLQSMVLTLKGKKIPLDVSGMFNPWNFVDGAHYINRKGFSIKHSWGDTWIVSGGFSDGAGFYSARWLVSEGKSLRTMLIKTEPLADICGVKFCATFK